MAGASMAMRCLVQLHERAAELPQAVRLLSTYGGRMFFMADNGRLLIAESGTDVADATVVRVLPSDEAAADTALCLQYLPDSDQVCVSFASGNIMLVSQDGAVELVGSIDGGIRAMQWSTDGEVTAIVTGTARVLVMTRTFEPIAELPLHANDLGEAAPVSVGWGRKETQFRGRAGKLTPEALAAASAVARMSPYDDGSVRIAWIGDGRFFAVSALEEESAEQGSIRRVRVFTRDGKLHSKSEHLPMLEHPLAWMPSGELLAATQVLPSGARQVTFIERNGLAHGNFALRAGSADDHRVLDLSWNADTTVLAVWLLDATTNNHFVQLWTMANYHYELKQEFAFDAASPPTALLWDPERPLLLHLCTQDAKYISLTFVTDVLTDTRLVPTNAGMTAVVDGALLRLTPFKVAVVPPPSSLHTAELPLPVRHISFSPPADDAVWDRRTRLLALLRDGSVTRVAFENGVREPPTITALAGVKSNGARQLVWFTRGRFAVLRGDGAVDSVDLYGLDGDAASFERSVAAPAPVTRIVALTDGALIAETSTGALVCIDGDDAAVPGALPIACPWLLAVPGGRLLALSERGRLFLDGAPLASNVTSVAVHSGFIVLTTVAHVARFVPLACSVEEAQALLYGGDDAAAGAAAAAVDATTRAVERGSRIVAAVPYDVQLVLEMPRGNLEVVAPRPMVLATVRAAIDQGNFAGAFALCRRHRIDMNILVDHAPEAFFADVPAFVAQLRDPDNINLFLSSLRDEYVDRKLYPDPLRIMRAADSAATRDHHADGKVTRVCDEVLRALSNAKQFMKSRLTCHIVKTPPDLCAALAEIQAIRADAEEAADAVEYAAFLTDINTLFDEALGLYDLELALLIAKRSQKDPKEYLPFLTDLLRRELPLRRFAIDDHLKRRARALAHLLSAGDAHFDEAIAYMERHALYTDALPLLRGEPAKYRRALLSYAQYRESPAGGADDVVAADAYEAAGDLARAAACHERAFAWRRALPLIARVDGDKAVTEAAQRMADALADAAMFRDAAALVEEELADYSRAFECCVAAGAWDEARRLAVRRALPADAVRKAACASAQAETADVVAATEQMRAVWERVQAIRNNKAALAAAMLAAGAQEDEAGEEEAGRDDLFSDTSTVASTRSNRSRSSRMTGTSGMTSSSRRSSRNRRKEERRRERGKEGSVYEEGRLIRSLGAEVARAMEPARDETRRALLRTLAAEQCFDEARALQAAWIAYFETAAAMWDKMFDEYVPPVEDDAPPAEIAANAVTKPTLPRVFTWRLDFL